MILHAENEAAAKIRLAFAQARDHIHSTRAQQCYVRIRTIFAVAEQDVSAPQQVPHNTVRHPHELTLQGMVFQESTRSFSSERREGGFWGKCEGGGERGRAGCRNSARRQFATG